MGGRLSWERITVKDGVVVYGTVGSGPPVLFLHGWGLGYRSYRRSLEHIAARGVRVYAPALPGFGGTPALVGEDCSIAGYARWTAEFLDAVGIEDPVALVGHSFGGGVAIELAHQEPARVRHLVLVNSIGGSAWTRGKSALRSLAERPLWD